MNISILTEQNYNTYQSRVRQGFVKDFIDGSYNCPRCGINVYRHISQFTAETDQITSCPLCKVNFPQWNVKRYYD